MKTLGAFARDVINPLVPVKSGFSKIHLFDLPTTWSWLRNMRFKDDFILEIKHGGIGDHLFYSRLPELLLQKKLCQRVWISEFSAMRSADIRSIIWESNPYVAGFIRKHGWHNSGLRPTGGNFLDGLVSQFTGHIPAPGSTRPALYWPAEKPPRGSFVLWDFNRISNRHRIRTQNVLRHLAQTWETTPEILCYESPFIKEMMAQESRLQALRDAGRLTLLPQEEKLADYFLRIAQATHWFGFYSGGANIAAAYGTPSTIYCEEVDPAISFSETEYVSR